MKINRHIHQTLRLKNFLATVLILTLLFTAAWLSRQYHTQIDLSANAGNTLSETSVKVLEKIPDAVIIKAFINEAALKRQLSQLLKRYQQVKANITVEFIDPKLALEQAREYNIGQQGAVVVEYRGRSEKITYVDETSLTNALLQLASTQELWITFLSGHGERSPAGLANFDLGLFGQELKKRRIKARTLSLTTVAAIPDNSSLLVLAGPAVALLPGELDIISQYINAGGNVLILTDPDNHYLADIEQQLGIHKLPGTLVDSSSGLYGIDNPSFVLTSEYEQHPVTLGFHNIAVFPLTAALQVEDENEYLSEALLSSDERSWTESGEIAGKIRFDADSEEREGPLDFAFALTRELNNGKQQRIIIIGDGDFLSNAYLGNVGNLELGLRMINWLTENDQFIDIPAKMTLGKTLQLSTVAIAIIGLGFLIILPAAFFVAGFIIWRKRKRR
jgi:ABC-type uncharacterized transport system involved in gliding motility auxiliary subunit